MSTKTDLTSVDSRTVRAIYDWHKKRGDAEPSRGYLGASIIGHECERYLWYNFRGACKPNISGRVYRLFETGDLEEDRFIHELQAIGCDAHSIHQTTGKQFAVEAFGGHFSGHMDGCALGIPEAPKTWHVLEFKTHNAKSFAKLRKDGVQASKPQHYAQMQMYMHLTGMTRALYLAKNKDTDELYSERVKYDKLIAESLMSRAKRIITSAKAPDRISDRPDWYACKWCDAHEVCWGTGETALPILKLSCVQCCWATPDIESGEWSCEHGDAHPNADGSPCEKHLTLPDMLTFADVQEYGKDSGCIAFKNKTDEASWLHGEPDNAFSSKELMNVPKPGLGSACVRTAKRLMGARVGDTLLGKYNVHYQNNDNVVWSGPDSEFEEKWRALYGEEIKLQTPTRQEKDDEFRCQMNEYHGQFLVLWWPEKARVEIRKLPEW